jgi:DNA modification methylase
MIKLLDSIFNIISWVIVTIIYVGPVYIALIFIANSKIGDNIKIKLGISENEKQESFLLKLRQHPLFSLLVLITLIWFYYKNLDAKYLSSILKVNVERGLHPTQKPLKLFKTLISAFTDENDYVLDNTMGVGTTCLGAKELNRSFIGIEKEVKYYDLAVARVFGQHCH